MILYDIHHYATWGLSLKAFVKVVLPMIHLVTESLTPHHLVITLRYMDSSLVKLF